MPLRSDKGSQCSQQARLHMHFIQSMFILTSSHTSFELKQSLSLVPEISKLGTRFTSKHELHVAISRHLTSRRTKP